jgi:hypothetical protein
VLAGGFLAGSNGVGAVQAWRQYRALAAGDPSAADLYQTTALLDAGILVVSVLAAWLV